ncbi:MAG: hypothetical protein ABI608_11235 [Rhizomicrobium sp.]
MKSNITAYALCAFALLAGPALAQPAPKTLAENTKAKVTDSTLAAGSTTTIGAPQEALLARYYLTSGTLEYTFADGTKQNVTRTAGSAVIVSPGDKRPATVKNIGTTALHFITVAVK